MPDAARRPPPLGQQWVRMQLTEGKNRTVRRCWEEFGFTVRRLIRTAYGPFRLGTLPEGGVAEVSTDELRRLVVLGPGR